ncbi:MAG: hypothetical protein OEQ28_05780 [Acidobacteriota bacterium]|nr:hypothetical protein [Acidobacteriota bacterium]
MHLGFFDAKVAKNAKAAKKFGFFRQRQDSKFPGRNPNVYGEKSLQ